MYFGCNVYLWGDHHQTNYWCWKLNLPLLDSKSQCLNETKGAAGAGAVGTEGTKGNGIVYVLLTWSGDGNRWFLWNMQQLMGSTSPLQETFNCLISLSLRYHLPKELTDTFPVSQITWEYQVGLASSRRSQSWLSFYLHRSKLVCTSECRTAENPRTLDWFGLEGTLDTFHPPNLDNYAWLHLEFQKNVCDTILIHSHSIQIMKYIWLVRLQSCRSTGKLIFLGELQMQLLWLGTLLLISKEFSEVN